MDTKTPYYIVVSDDNKTLFEKKINEFVKNGYSLQGGISVIKKDSKEKMYNSHSYNYEGINESYRDESYRDESYRDESYRDDSLIYFQALIKN